MRLPGSAWPRSSPRSSRRNPGSHGAAGHGSVRDETDLQVLLGADLALGACASGTASQSSAPPISLGGGPTAVTGTPAPTAASTAATPSPTPSAVATSPGSINPCSLLTSAQASTLVGATLGAGKEDQPPGPRICVYGSDAAQVSVSIGIVQAASAAAAQAAMAHVLAGLKNDVTTALPGFADGATIARATDVPGHYTDGIYVQDGSNFFFISPYGPGAGPDDAALKFAATVGLGNLP
jgi:hypothetical protein